MSPGGSAHLIQPKVPTSTAKLFQKTEENKKIKKRNRVKSRTQSRGVNTKHVPPLNNENDFSPRGKIVQKMQGQIKMFKSFPGHF